MTAALLIALSYGAPPHGARASEHVKRPSAVVELFTSQGCNSCPPADDHFATLARRGDVVALAYHVDYWDYLGWRDTLATPDNTMRQQEYSRSFGKRSVYTPQVVLNGRHQVNGAKRLKVEGAIALMNRTGQGLSVDVEITYSGDTVVIETGAARQPVKDAQVVLVYLNKSTEVTIDRGENTGRAVTYVNAVSSFHTAGKWSGQAARFELPMSEVAKKGPGGYAVLVQEMKEGGLPGPILGAAIATLPSS